MKKIIFIFFIIHCSFLVAEAQWIKQFSPNHAIRDIEFINRSTGWVEKKEYVGLHTVEWKGTNLTSGRYFYRLIAGEFLKQKK